MLRQCQAKAYAALLACAHKWFKECVTNGVGNSFAGVANADLNLLFILRERDNHLGGANSSLRSLARIEQQIIKSATQLRAVHPGFDRIQTIDENLDLAALRMVAYGLDRAFHQYAKLLKSKVKNLAGPTE